MSWIVTINAGSSTLKYAAFDLSLKPLLRGQTEGSGEEALSHALQALSLNGAPVQGAAGISHRLVHGGQHFTQPVIVDAQTFTALQALVALAPLHMPYGLSALGHLRQAAPHVPQIACFDTAFHSHRPQVSMRYALPRDLSERGFLRFGFHGLNYEHVVNALPRQNGAILPERLIVAHLGSGASACAILRGRSVETTMGYSTLDGLMMGTRTGSIDPGLILALLRDEGLSLIEVETLLYKKSGLLGVSGVSADMRELLASPEPGARDAVDLYCYQAAKHITALTVPLKGVDALVFTGGVGENATIIRKRIIDHLAHLQLNPLQIHVVKADEEMTLARHCLALL